MKFGIFQLNIDTVGWDTVVGFSAIGCNLEKKLLFLQNSEENSVEKMRNNSGWNRSRSIIFSSESQSEWN